MYGGDEVSAIVIDLGSNTCKGGYAGEDTPKAVFPSSVGVIDREEEVTDAGKDKEEEPGKSDGDKEMKDADGEASAERQRKKSRTYYVNQLGCYRRDNMEVINPYGEDGCLEDWDLVERLWSHTLRKCLLVDPTEHPLLLAEPSYVPKAHREKTTELMFEKNGVPALFLAKNSVLTSFASGKATSLVLDIGGQGTCVSAVHDGYALSKGTLRTSLGGDLLTNLMLRACESQGIEIKPRYSFKRTAKGGGEFEVSNLDFPNTTVSYREYCRREIAADLKESLCRVSDQQFQDGENTNIPTVRYELPDGNEIEVGFERFKVPEVLFQPSLLPSFPNTEALANEDGSPVKGLPALIVEAISKCDVDVRKELTSNVLLTGGMSSLPVLRDRLERELSEQVAPTSGRVKVTTPNALVERKFSVFIGGSILASLGSFQQMWMSKAEYEEHGASRVHRKCP